MEIYFKNPNETCRICYTINNNSEPLFGNPDLLNKVLEFVQFELTDQKQLPKAICKSCKTKTIIYVDFRRKCQQSNDQLLDYYRKYLSDRSEDNSDNDSIKFDTYKEEEGNKRTREAVELFENRLSPADQTGTESKVEDGRKIHKCEVCGKHFTTRQILKTHKLLHVNDKHFICDECGKEFTCPSHYKYHLTTHAEKQFNCDYCGKGFHTRALLKCHFLTHTGEKSYQCEWCPKAFSIPVNLARHRLIHTKEKPFKCKLCHLRFTYLKALKYHMKDHDAPKPFRCTMCPAAFTTSASLHSHGRAHMGEYKCTECDMEFIKKVELKKHMGTVHRKIRQKRDKLNIEPVVKPYKCDLCPKSFLKEDGLTKHSKFHQKDNPYQCVLCNLRYSSYNAIRYHLKSHSNIKDYKCDQCDKAYKAACNLVKHRKISGHIQLHKCKICDVEFETSGLLGKHHRIKHTDRQENGIKTNETGNLVVGNLKESPPVQYQIEPTNLQSYYI